MEILDPAAGVPDEPQGEARPVARLGKPRRWPQEHVRAVLRLTPGFYEQDGCCSPKGKYIWPAGPTFAVRFALDDLMQVRAVTLEANGQQPTLVELDQIRAAFTGALRSMEAVHEDLAAIAGWLDGIGVHRAAELVVRLKTILAQFPEEADAGDVISRAQATLWDLTGE